MKKKSEVNETISIEQPVFLKRSVFKQSLYRILSFVTLGVIPILFYWFSNLEKWLYTRTSRITEADHVLVVNKVNKKEKIAVLHHETIKFLPHKTANTRYFFNYKKHVYYFKESGVKVLHNEMMRAIKKQPEVIKRYLNGSHANTRDDMQKLYKRNLIEIESDSIFYLFLKELISPYTIFQIWAIIVWAFDDYMLYGMVILVMMALAIIGTVYENYTQAVRMRKMTYINEPVQVYKKIVPTVETSPESNARMFRKDLFMKLMSIDLVVGDIVTINKDEHVTADIMLLEGKCLMNEAMLTGETVPVLKRPFSNTMKPSEVNIVYSGTECIMAKDAVGIVLNTGFYTKKGEIIRTLLFTEQREFKFKTDAFRLLGIIFIIVTCFFFWFIICIQNSIYIDYYEGWTLLIKGAEMFTVAVPPVLPLALTIGLEIASQRLRKLQIYSLFLDKINTAGKVKLCCFDKTGTLTQNVLEFRGLLPIYNTEEDWDVKVSEAELAEQFISFNPFYNNMEEFERENTISVSNRNHIIYEIMACCQSLQMIDGELVGDPMEIQFFNQTAFTLKNDIDAHGMENVKIFPDEFFAKKLKLRSTDYYTIEQTLDFTSDRKRMSVIANMNGRRRLLVKGAPEIIKNLCFSQNLPFNFDDELQGFTEQGFRVLALAYKDLDNEPITEDIENGLQFVAFTIFENPLKEGSKETLATLRECDIRSTIITGDNIMTALSVGLSLHMFDFSSRLFLASLENGEIEWEEIENEQQRRERGTSLHVDDSSYFMSRRSSSRSFASDLRDQKDIFSTILKECYKDNCVVCITGDAFEKLFSKVNMKRKSYQKLISCIFIYARTSPHQKALVVAKYQEYLKVAYQDDWFVCFCGDGANDSEALKQADVGVSLSHSEALLAASFNTTRENVSCLIDLFIQAKCSLETALQNAKYVLFYSLLQFICVLAVYLKATEFNNMAYFYWDIIIFVPLSIFMNNTAAVKTLNKKYPQTSLMNKELIISLFGHIGLCGIFVILLQVVAYTDVNNLEIFESLETKSDSGDSLFYRDTQPLIFFCSIFNIWAALFFSRGYPFKRNIFTNVWVIVWVFVFTIVTISITYARYTESPYWFAFTMHWLFRYLKEDISYIHNYVAITFIAVVTSYILEIKLFRKFKIEENRKARVHSRKSLIK